MNLNEYSPPVPQEELSQLVLDRPTQLLYVWILKHGLRIYANNQSQVYQYGMRDFQKLAQQSFEIKYLSNDLKEIAESELNEMLQNLNSETIFKYYQSETFFYKLMTETILSQNMTKIFQLRLPIFLMKLKIQQLKQDQIKELIVYRGISVSPKQLQQYLTCFNKNRRLYFLNFQSCSTNEQIAIGFMNKNCIGIRNQKILFKINTNCRFIGNNSEANPRESEWILDSVIQFKIIDYKEPTLIMPLDQNTPHLIYQDYHIFEVVVEDYEREEQKHTALIEDGIYSDVSYFFKFYAFFQVNKDDILQLKADYIMEDFNIETAINIQICTYLNTQGQLEKLKKICQEQEPKLNQMKIKDQYEFNIYLSRIAAREGKLEICLRYSQEAIRLSKRMQNEYFEAMVLNYIGIAYTEFDQLENAYEVLNEGYQRFCELKEDPKYSEGVRMVGIYNSLGYCLLSKRQFTEAYPLLKLALESWQIRLGVNNITTAYSMLRMAQCLFCIYEEQDEFTYENRLKLSELVTQALKLIEPEKETQEESYSRAMFLLSLLERKSENRNSELAHQYLQLALKLPENNARFNHMKSTILFLFPEKPNYSYLNCGVNAIIYFALQDEKVKISKKSKIVVKQRIKSKKQLNHCIQNFNALNDLNSPTYNQVEIYFDEEFKQN